MYANIFSIETAIPPHIFSQDEVVETMIEMLSLGEREGRGLRKLYSASAIKQRHSVLPDFQKNAERSFWGKEFPKVVPGTEARNEIYKKQAPILALEAAKKALKSWGGEGITHVVAVSCTGVIVPGLEFSLIEGLGLSPNVMRLGVNFMGCFGAFQGLSVANAFAKENPNHRVLVVCAELCSLHFQADLRPDTLIANSLFSDGAAAVVVGCGVKGNERPLWQIEKRMSFGLKNSAKDMTWDVGDAGFAMRLSKEVPALIEEQIAPFCHRLLGKDDPASCDWAIHPGGKKIIQAVEKSLGLSEAATSMTWEVLANHGNMSSATVLFVLKELKNRETLASLGFGPGLSIEGMVLKR